MTQSNDNKIVANVAPGSTSIHSTVQSDDNRIVANVVSGSTPIHSTMQSKDKSIQSTVGIAPSATTERKGIIRIATDEEAIEGILANTAITPHTLRLVTNYVHEQGIASDTWVINHNLNKYPSVTIVDTLDRAQVPDDIYYNSNNQMTVTFLAAFAGKAYLN